MELLLKNITEMSWTEAIAALMGIIGVLYLQAGRTQGYPIGMISVSLYVWICFNAKLYAHAGVNAYYFLMNIYGWYHWLRGEDGKKANYRYAKRWEYTLLLIGLPICATILYHVLGTTDSDVAIWDATTTSIWIAAMWLLARKRIENWIGWITADLVCIVLYYHKGLLLTSIQMLIFLCLATVGFFRWKKHYQAQKASEANAFKQKKECAQDRP